MKNPRTRGVLVLVGWGVMLMSTAKLEDLAWNTSAGMQLAVVCWALACGYLLFRLSLLVYQAFEEELKR